MAEILTIIILFWVPVLFVIIKNIFWDLYFWQIKEYRLDRFWTHIRWDQDDRNRNYNITNVKFVLFALSTLIFQVPALTIVAIALSYFLWNYEVLQFIDEVYSKKISKPSLKSPRNIAIILLILAFVIGLIAIISAPFLNIDRPLSSDQETPFEMVSNTATSGLVYSDIYILLGLSTLLALILDMAVPIYMPFFILLTYPFPYFKKKFVISKALNKMKLVNKNLVIIGITGSQGKTTTKELLYELLKNKFKVVKTPENYNTDFGIASTIINDLKEDTEILILEIGTYRKGEIEKICKLFPPNISLVTDVDTQHLGMFGSREALARGKGEIIRYMNKNGVAILNADNKYCREYSEIFNVKMDFVSSKKSNFEKVKALETVKNKYYLANEISPTKAGISLNIVDSKDTKYKIQAKGVSEHLTNNLLMVIAAAEEVGMSVKEINETLKEIEFKSPRLSIDTGDNGMTVINDTYSSSRKGFIAAVNTMHKAKEENNLHKTVLVTKGILELGKAKKNIYKAMMKRLKDKINVLITTDFLLAEVAKENNLHMAIHYVKSSDQMLYTIRTEAGPGDIILLEGRLNPKVIRHIVSDYK